MAILGSAWEFRQVRPPNGAQQAKVITLNSYQAPFGRLRKAPVMDTEFMLRETEVYYAGLRTPTRLIFGDKEEPIVLKGRWSDKYLGQGGANDLALRFKQFVADSIQCTIKWGQIVAYTGLPYRLRIGREDGSNLTWELSIKVDADLALLKVVPTLDGVPQSVNTSASNITSDLSQFVSGVENNAIVDDLNPNFLEQLASLLAAIRNAEANFYDATQNVQDYASATRDQLNQITGAITQLRTGIVNLQDAIDTVTLAGITFVRTADVDFEWFSYKSNSDLVSDSVLYQLATMDRQCLIAERGQNQVTTLAVEGDTWEIISIRVYGQADGANTLRQANGATYGQQPTPGFAYVVPLTTQDF